MNGAVFPPAPSSVRRHRLALLGRLQDAEDDHDRMRRQTFASATGELLDADKARWTRLGDSLAALARLVCKASADSVFCDSRPGVDLVTVRLSEAIDDQFDRESWRVIDAAARLAAVE